MKIKLILKKELSRTVVENIETIKNSIIELFLPDNLKDEIYDLLEREDDPESQYHTYGVATGFDGEVVFLSIGKFVEQLQYEIKENCDDEFDYKTYQLLVDFFKEYKDYQANWKEIEDDKVADKGVPK